jgi:hypothetical protein
MVTMLVLLTVVDALLQGFGEIVNLAQSTSGLTGVLAITLMFVIIGIMLFLAWGLWQLKNWARIGLIVIIVLNFILTIPDLVSAMPDNLGIGVAALIVAAIFRGAIIYWLAANGRYFAPQASGPSGPMVSQSDGNSAALKFAGIGCLVLMALLVVSVVGALAVMRLNLQAATFASATDVGDVGDLSAIPTVTPPPTGFAHVALNFDVQGREVPGALSDLKYPGHLAVDPQGNIYLQSSSSLHIYKYDPTGKYIGGWDIDPKVCTAMQDTDNLAADRTGDIFVHCVRSGWGVILKYNAATGKFLTEYDGMKSSPPDDYKNMAVYSDGGLLVVSDESPVGHEALLHLSPTGKLLARFPNPVNGVTKGSTDAFEFLPALDSSGNIFILNMQNATVYKFSSAGKFVSQFDSANWGPVPNNPGLDASLPNLAVDDQGRVYVNDSMSIKVFDDNGTYLDSMNVVFANDVQDMKIANGNELYLIGLGNHPMLDGDSEIYKLLWKQP